MQVFTNHRAGGFRPTDKLPDAMDPLKQQLQAIWATGDFSKVGGSQILAGELLCEFVPVHAGDRVLDVATGAGNTALAAARRGCEVTGVDFVEALLERGRERAAAERLHVDFQFGETEELPFPDGSFDVVLSTFGSMFAPRPVRAAAEMARVCRPGGKIGMTAWTPDGLIGQTFALNAKYAPLPPGIEPPVLWGVEEKATQRFEPYTREIRLRRQQARFRGKSPEQWLEFMKKWFGPTIRTFGQLPPEKQEALGHELVALVASRNMAENGTLMAEGEYLEICVTRA
jgi:ubiquinone/menaquinone biosynthesis C-methylase UbiE